MMKHRAATTLGRRVIAPSKDLARRLQAAALPIAVILGSTLVWLSSDAAFIATNPTGTNNWKSGTVALSNTPTTAVINVAGPIPGSFGSTCVRTTYTGTLPADVRLYLKASDLTGNLGPYLTLQIKEGTGGDAACTGFVSSATLYNATGLTDTTKTVTGFSATANSYATGMSRWIAMPNVTRTYQFNWQLQDDNTAQSDTAGITFTWEARST